MEAGRTHLRGLTLVELCVCLSITSVLCSIALPAMSRLRHHQTLVASTNAMIHALQLTRIQAITTRQAQQLCPAGPHDTCLKSTDWSNGWLMIPVKESDAPPPAHHGGPGKGVLVQSTAGRTQVRYNSDGTSPGTNVTITLCNSAGTNHVVVNNTGRVRSTRTIATC